MVYGHRIRNASLKFTNLATDVELVQIGGSHHDWFEGRSDKCCLLVFIDDVTGRLMNLQLSISDVVTLCSSTILRCHLFIHFLMTLKKRLVTVALSFFVTL